MRFWRSNPAFGPIITIHSQTRHLLCCTSFFTAYNQLYVYNNFAYIHVMCWLNTHQGESHFVYVLYLLKQSGCKDVPSLSQLKKFKLPGLYSPIVVSREVYSTNILILFVPGPVYYISRDSLLYDSNCRNYSSMFREYFNIIYSGSISCTYRWMLYITGCLYFLHMHITCAYLQRVIP